MTGTIYTAIFSPYDDLKRPLVVTPGWRYVCYTDQDITSDIWEIVKLPKGNQRTAREYKINFHKHVDTYKSIWIDAQFIINTNLDEWWARMKHPMTVLKHPDRTCVYDEAQECLKLMKDNPAILKKQRDWYRKCGLPARAGLAATGIMMREKSQEVISLCEAWWREIEQFSVRDQVSLPYIQWRAKEHLNLPDTIGVLNWDYRGHNGFEFIQMPHLNSKKRRERKIRYYVTDGILPKDYYRNPVGQ